MGPVRTPAAGPREGRIIRALREVGRVLASVLLGLALLVVVVAAVVGVVALTIGS